MIAMLGTEVIVTPVLVLATWRTVDAGIKGGGLGRLLDCWFDTNMIPPVDANLVTRVEGLVACLAGNAGEEVEGEATVTVEISLEGVLIAGEGRGTSSFFSTGF